jgi:Flp pilus assembly protein CpaB
MKKQHIILLVALVAIGTAAYFLYQTAYKYGYAAGTKNQIICQASEQQESLKQLCVR